MTEKPKTGGYIYKAAIQRGRQNTNTARTAIRRVVEDNPGPQTLAALLTKTALALAELESVFTELDQIIRNTKEKGSHDG